MTFLIFSFSQSLLETNWVQFKRLISKEFEIQTLQTGFIILLINESLSNRIYLVCSCFREMDQSSYRVMSRFSSFT